MYPELNRLYVYSAREFPDISKKDLGVRKKYDNKPVYRFVLSKAIDGLSKNFIVLTDEPSLEKIKKFFDESVDKLNTNDLSTFKRCGDRPVPTSLIYQA